MKKKPHNPYASKAFPHDSSPDFSPGSGCPPGYGISEADFLAAAVISNSALIPYAGSPDEVAGYVFDLVEGLIRERVIRSERFEKAANFSK